MMAYDQRSLGDYIEVGQRIADFRELYPEGSLQPADPARPWEQATVTGYDKDGRDVTQTFIVYVAAAYRTPDDKRPGIGIAWEVFPGRTNFTRGSEIQNAETSAWGRAIVAVLASDSKRGVASREEVAARRAERDDGLPTNADGSLSRSRTTDQEKAAAGVMTAAQLAEHTALGGGHPNERKTPAAERPKVVHLHPCDCNACRSYHEPWMLDGAAVDGDHPEHPPPSDDPWAASFESENAPGSVHPGQQRAIHAACTGMDRDKRLATISDIVGRRVTSSNELSYTEAARVLAKLSGARA